jgi:hypothetical protein
MSAGTVSASKLLIFVAIAKLSQPSTTLLCKALILSIFVWAQTKIDKMSATSQKMLGGNKSACKCRLVAMFYLLTSS